MTYEPGIKKALVVLSPDLIEPDKPLQSTLLKRAVSLAKETGCVIELFHACYDGDLEYKLFGNSADLDRLKETLVDREATKLAEIATRLKEERVDVQHEVRWDYPRTDAILRKIAQSQPDVVMKQSREHSYVLGITSNTDWDLARRSPAHVWLVNENQGEINRLIAAVGNKLDDNVDITTWVDHEIMGTARDIADTFKAKVYPVNAYQVPRTVPVASGMPMAIAPVPADEKDDLRRELTKRHESAVQALTQLFLIDPDNVRICEGRPDHVIAEVSDQISADMIVIGADNLSRLERFLTPVTVEPVMAQTNADILIVRDSDRANIPDTATGPFHGVPNYDLEQAISDPRNSFASPQEVVDMDGVSIGLRKRILQAWEYDIRAEMVNENEGGPVRNIDSGSLDEIHAATKALEEANASLESGAEGLGIVAR